MRAAARTHPSSISRAPMAGVTAWRRVEARTVCSSCSYATTALTSKRCARAYGAVCTPDFFGYNAALHLQYRGRLDASGRQAIPNARRELFDAMEQIARTGRGPADQVASIGCSIEWKRS